MFAKWSDREIEKNRESNPARDVHSLRFSARMNSGLGFDVGSCRLCSVRFLFTHLIILSLSKYAKSFKWNEYTENCYFGSCFVYRTILRSTNIIIHFSNNQVFYVFAKPLIRSGLWFSGYTLRKTMGFNKKNGFKKLDRSSTLHSFCWMSYFMRS